ncbi:MAG TPA: hypothetical protein VGD05_07250 [Pyrinomonadaceae bacterium]|jgi:hypothetical protein
MGNAKKTAKEIYFLYHETHGSITGISSQLGRNDSSKLSRQINPNDDQRDNFYEELLEVHEAMMEKFPNLEEKIWNVIERRRAAFRAAHPTHKMQRNEHIYKVHRELGDVMHKNNVGASKEELVQEAFELVQAGKELFENIASDGQTREEIKETYIS